MSDHLPTHGSHGFADHHHVVPAATPLDPAHRASAAVKRTVHDLVHGRIAAPAEPPLPAGHIEVCVPFDYVEAVAFHAARELHRRGCRSGFSVKVDPDAPQVLITWTPAETLARRGGAGGGGHEQRTNCLAAHLAQLDAQHVGVAAVDAFVPALERALHLHTPAPAEGG